jgi:hypothetical protein
LSCCVGQAGEEHPAHHRVAVWDLDGVDAQGDDAMRVTAVVSQSDVVRCAPFLSFPSSDAK